LQPLPTAETGTVGWRVLDWVLDWQLTVSNTTQPTGGTSAVLDALGDERDVPRAPGEDDNKYRIRVAQLPDTVSPNALRRTANRVLAPFGLTGCLREAGLALLPGAYFDNDSYDNDGLDFVGTLVLPFSSRFFQGELVEQLHSDGSIATATVVGPTALFRNLSPSEDYVTWQPSTLTGFQQRVVATNTGIRIVFVALNNGITGTTEPNWPVTPGALTPDGTVVWGVDRFYPSGEPLPVAVGGQKIQVARCRGTFTSTDPLVGQRSGAQFNPNALTVTPNIVNRFRYMFNYLEMRAFFMMGVPPTSLGEFGIAYDAGPFGFYDAAPYYDFYDGFPVTTAIVQRSIWQHLNVVRAGGVTQDLYSEPIGCV
jgi:hypothetical protein